MKKFIPQSPDPYMLGDQRNMTLARFGHLNALVDQINLISGGPVTTGITAYAGGGQTNATQLNFGTNEITVCATAGDSVKLQPAQADARIIVINDGATACDVFPFLGDTINDGAVNIAVRVAPGNETTFTAINGTNWETSTQTIAAGNGTAAAPSITFENQPNMGLYRISATQMGITVGGVLHTIFDSTTGMILGDLAAPNGTVALPSITFSSTPDMGFYRISGTQMGITVSGVLQVMINDSSLSTGIIRELVQGSGLGLLGITPAALSASNAGPIILTAGTGGTAAGATGGNGGAIAISAGYGGNSDQNGGAGAGYVSQAGTGGDTSSAAIFAGGAGGNYAIYAGNGGDNPAGTGAGGKGGSVLIEAGSGGSAPGGTPGLDGNIIFRSVLLQEQLAPAAKTVDATLTAAEILTGIITVNQGAAGTSAQQLPTGTDFSAALVDTQSGDSFDFSVINTSIVAAEDVTITTNTDWTLVGSMVIEANDNDRARSSARFRARKTGANTWTLYRLS